MVDSASAHLMQVHRVLFAYEHTESYASEACTHFQSNWFSGIYWGCKWSHIPEFEVFYGLYSHTDLQYSIYAVNFNAAVF